MQLIVIQFIVEILISLLHVMLINFNVLLMVWVSGSFKSRPSSLSCFYVLTVFPNLSVANNPFEKINIVVKMNIMLSLFC